MGDAGSMAATRKLTLAFDVRPSTTSFGLVLGIEGERVAAFVGSVACCTTNPWMAMPLVHVATISPDDTVEDAMRLMPEKKVRHLPVMEDGHLLGFVSIGDMVNCIISAQSAAIDQLEAYVSGR